MTREEINKFLADTKVYVAGRSEEIQKKLFSLGCKWCASNTEVDYIEAPFLYIDKNHYLSHGRDMCFFTEHGYREISAEEILSLELTEKFNPKTLQPFDRVLVRNENYQVWQCDLFSHIKNGGIQFMYRCVSSSHKCCIPYNDDTKHLVGTTEEAPEYFRYWEDEL